MCISACRIMNYLLHFFFSRDSRVLASQPLSNSSRAERDESLGLRNSRDTRRASVTTPAMRQNEILVRIGSLRVRLARPTSLLVSKLESEERPPWHMPIATVVCITCLQCLYLAFADSVVKRLVAKRTRKIQQMLHHANVVGHSNPTKSRQKLGSWKSERLVIRGAWTCRGRNEVCVK
jgi:hypothetical protein